MSSILFCQHFGKFTEECSVSIRRHIILSDMFFTRIKRLMNSYSGVRHVVLIFPRSLLFMTTLRAVAIVYYVAKVSRPIGRWGRES